MRVLITADTLGGVWTYARELVTALVRRGVQVTLVSFGEIPVLEQVRWIEGLDGLDFRPTGFRLEWMQDSAEDLAASAEYLRMVIAEVKPDLLHFNQFYYGALETDLPKVVVAHSDVITWWQAVHKKDPDDSAWIRWYREVVSRGIAGADVLVAPTRIALDQTLANFVTSKREQVIWNGRSPELFAPYLDKQPYAVSVGRVWDFGKNAALLTRIESPWPIYLAGNNQDPNAPINAHALHLGDGRLIFKGVLAEAELRRLYAGASLYIATSQYEPFGLAPLEAALSRCAILASDMPSLREVWGDAAIYFRNNDPKHLEATMYDVCAQPRVLDDFASRAFNRARSTFTADRMAEQYLAMYRSLVPAEVIAA